ncbi:TfoX/Sxy family DNA transformation protein [Chelatococcus asaccharovorans]|mgnify:CR=1 FL=1|uniref:TfoX/Sxy family DNA transformation protein n=1 Tax=Chelatococcus asaccharovorans TaxID=28210 RepID=UPI00224C7407|nr:TfoX/Sxy family DNA transformation protein [Chelatococcus asaccharovorans]CAH1673792.1 TfoX-like protein [Chelatococcus asaccharovorans]CAH1674804.1 TfoX-like protein [Chelatococcus asaccharovorans]
MSRPIAEMRNLGPATARMLAEVDIGNEEALRRLGAVEAYHRLKFRFGRHVTLVALYAMEAALRGCDWRSLEPSVRDDLRKAARRP